MSKSVQKVKNSLKFKAQVRDGLLSIRVGVKKYTLPVSVRILSDEQYIFLSFPACSELFRVSEKELEPMGAADDASEAFALLNPGRRRGRRRGSLPNLPDELESALKNIPPGYKIGYDPATGQPRLVRKRQRRVKV